MSNFKHTKAFLEGRDAWTLSNKITSLSGIFFFRVTAKFAGHNRWVNYTVCTNESSVSLIVLNTIFDDVNSIDIIKNADEKLINIVGIGKQFLFINTKKWYNRDTLEEFLEDWYAVFLSGIPQIS